LIICLLFSDNSVIVLLSVYYATIGPSITWEGAGVKTDFVICGL
jgi:hypothetical protein